MARDAPGASNGWLTLSREAVLTPRSPLTASARWADGRGARIRGAAGCGAAQPRHQPSLGTAGTAGMAGPGDRDKVGGERRSANRRLSRRSSCRCRSSVAPSGVNGTVVQTNEVLSVHGGQLSSEPGRQVSMSQRAETTGAAGGRWGRTASRRRGVSAQKTMNVVGEIRDPVGSVRREPGAGTGRRSAWSPSRRVPATSEEARRRGTRSPGLLQRPGDDPPVVAGTPAGVAPVGLDQRPHERARRAEERAPRG